MLKIKKLLQEFGLMENFMAVENLMNVKITNVKKNYKINKVIFKLRKNNKV